MSIRIWLWSEHKRERKRSSIGSPSPPSSCCWATMSATTAAIAPCSSHLPPSRNRPASRSILAFRPTLACRSHSSTCSPSSSSFVFGEKLIFAVRNQCFLGSPSISRPFSPVMEWQDCTVKMEIDVPISVAYKCYSQRESIPQWMPFISTVKVLDDKPDLSRWSLKYKAFGQDLEYSWLARNMQPILNQKIHWRSLEGLPNRGAVRFYPKSASSCLVELTVSYEVPQLLVPVASALKPFLENLLLRGLERFSRFAKSHQAS